MKNLKFQSFFILVAILLVSLGVTRPAFAGNQYSAVNDFTITANPNGPWSYLYDTGTGPQLLTDTIPNLGVPGVNSWWDGGSIPNSVVTYKNTTSSTVSFETIVLPTDLLGMDPEGDKSDIVRWTAPTAGTWSISGLFQGIDVNQHAHDVEILENSGTVILAPTTINAYGQQAAFSASVTLAAGDTINFLVLGGSDFTNLSTGLAASIELTSVPEPSSLVLAVAGSVASLIAGLARLAKRRSRGIAVRN